VGAEFGATSMFLISLINNALTFLVLKVD
jgi:hypothetical protein